MIWPRLGTHYAHAWGPNMNAPHVEALIYVVERDKSSDYSSAMSVERGYTTFRLKLEGGEARFELKTHYATQQQAQEAIRPFIQQWEFIASLRSGPGTFTLKFNRAEMIDCKPTPGAIAGSARTSSFHFHVGSPNNPTVTVSRQYPQPPSECRMNIDNPDVQMMLHRYMGYRQGREPLPSMAYFCYDVFLNRLGDGVVKHTAQKHNMSRGLVMKVGNLVSNKGGDQARKEFGIRHPLTHVQVQFLEKAVAAMIIRAAMVAEDPDQPMVSIDGSNLLDIAG